MADILKHLIVRDRERVVDLWSPHSWTVNDTLPYDDPMMSTATRYRLTLKSAVEYIISDGYKGDIHPAHQHARRRLVHHLYGPQLELGHKALDAVYGGASREEVAKLIGNLLESMTE